MHEELIISHVRELKDKLLLSVTYLQIKGFTSLNYI